MTVVASAAGEGPIHALRRRPPFRAPHHTLSYAAMVGGGPTLTPGRDHPGRPRGPVPGRAGRIRSGRPRGAPAAAGGGARRHRPGRSGDDVPGPVPAGRRDESLPVRARRVVRRRAAARARTRSSPATTDACPARCATGSTCGSRWPGSRGDARRAAGAGGRARSSAARIAAARARRRARNGGRLNARLRGRALRARLPARPRAPGAGSSTSSEAEAASGRGTERLLRVARTIADLAGAADVAADHLDEASWFRAAGDRPRRRPGLLMLGVGAAGPTGSRTRGRRAAAGVRPGPRRTRRCRGARGLGHPGRGGPPRADRLRGPPGAAIGRPGRSSMTRARPGAGAVAWPTPPGDRDGRRIARGRSTPSVAAAHRRRGADRPAAHRADCGRSASRS